MEPKKDVIFTLISQVYNDISHTQIFSLEWVINFLIWIYISQMSGFLALILFQKKKKTHRRRHNNANNNKNNTNI